MTPCNVSHMQLILLIGCFLCEHVCSTIPINCAAFREVVQWHVAWSGALKKPKLLMLRSGLLTGWVMSFILSSSPMSVSVSIQKLSHPLTWDGARSCLMSMWLSDVCCVQHSETHSKWQATQDWLTCHDDHLCKLIPVRMGLCLSSCRICLWWWSCDSQQGKCQLCPPVKCPWGGAVNELVHMEKWFLWCETCVWHTWLAVHLHRLPKCSFRHLWVWQWWFDIWCVSLLNDLFLIQAWCSEIFWNRCWQLTNPFHVVICMRFCWWFLFLAKSFTSSLPTCLFACLNFFFLFIPN